MSRHVFISAAALCAVFAAGACSSARVGGYQPYGGAAAGPSLMMEQPIEAVPSAEISSSPLEPIDGQPLPSYEGQYPGSPEPTDLAAIPPSVTPSAPAPAATRTAMVGSWTAREASGGTCRIQLSSSPALDLYRASASGCGNQDLSKVNAWDYRNGEVYLYQQGGSVAARLRGSSGALNGVLAKSGAPLSLSR